MKAIGYPRVSTYSQDALGFSLDDQIKSIEEFCQDKGIELTAHFLESESAKTIKDRPSFKAALRHLYNSPEVNAIIVTNLDRSSRSVLDSELIRQALARRGKRLISIQEQYLTPYGDNVDPEFEDYLETAIQHRMVESEAERKRIRKRFLRGRKAKEEKGGWIGFRPPYEYDVVQGELVVNHERARVVRLICRLRRILSWQYKEIAAYLNEKDIPPPHLAKIPQKKRRRPIVRGSGEWNVWSVRRIIVTDREWGPESGKQGRVKAV